MPLLMQARELEAAAERTYTMLKVHKNNAMVEKARPAARLPSMQAFPGLRQHCMRLREL